MLSVLVVGKVISEMAILAVLAIFEIVNTIIVPIKAKKVTTLSIIYIVLVK